MRSGSARVANPHSHGRKRDRRHSCGGNANRSLPAVLLESELLSLSILPDLGAKIYDLIWTPSGRQVLWQNPRIRPQPYPIDSNFDNYWCGGWDEGFPTCDACEHNGESYPNLGELRSVRWTLERLEGRVRNPRRSSPPSVRSPLCEL